MKSRLFRWIAYGASCLVFIVICLEIFGKYALPQLYQLLTDVDHRMKPYSEPGVNGDGLRSPYEASDVQDQGYNILVLGDSFVYGSLLEPEQTIPARLEALLREKTGRDDVHAINAGWVSSSPLLAYRLLMDMGDRYHPDAIILCFDMTDFENDLFYRKMLDRKGFYWLLNIAPMTFFMPKIALNMMDGPVVEYLYERLYGVPRQTYFQTLQPLEKSLPYFALSEQSIRSIHDWATDRGIPFSLVVLPRNFQYSDRESPDDWTNQYKSMRTEPLGPYVLEPFRYFEKWAGQVDFPVISLLKDFQDPSLYPTTFQYDSHFNPHGANLAARFILEHCTQMRCFPDLLGHE